MFKFKGFLVQVIYFVLLGRITDGGQGFRVGLKLTISLLEFSMFASDFHEVFEDLVNQIDRIRMQGVRILEPIKNVPDSLVLFILVHRMSYLSYQRV